jgi:hypothetical protein
MTAEKAPQGIRGWLLIFIALTLATAPASMLLTLAYPSILKAALEGGDPSPIMMPQWMMLTGVFLEALHCVAAVGLILKKTWSVRLVKKVLAASVAFYGILAVLVLVPALGVKMGTGTKLPPLLTACLKEAAWFLYFIRSKRVRNTFGSV